jgi:5-methylcytosine-specific restriction endonuclease McrA
VLNAKVLLLNQSYEPLSICNVKKALILMFLGKAEIVADKANKRIHSVSSSYPLPSIIRLNTYIRVPYKSIILTRKNILRRDNHKCVYCGRSDLTLTIDHIIPKARGGSDTWENLVAACVKCNNKKGDRTPDEANMPLRIKPYAPNHIMFMKNTVSRLDENWKTYLFQS